jgi:uncharacterized protein (TIGR00269 family)
MKYNDDMDCSKCGKKAIYEARYNGMRYCENHFAESVESRFKAEIRKQIRAGKEDRTVAVALSGGKDSSVLLYLIKKVLGKNKKIKVVAVTVDEGIEGYRNIELESAREICHALGVEHRVISFKSKFGITMDQVVQSDPFTVPCSHCGPMRRQTMNLLATRAEADYLALGINLDDYAQSVLMNVIKGDTVRMSRMAPHENQHDGLVKRVIPLWKIPEKEVLIYSILQGIKVDRLSCPYAGRAERNEIREIISGLEEKHPGTAYAIAKFGEEVKKSLASAGEYAHLGNCRICGTPTTSDICSVCRNLKQIPA